MGNNPVMKSAVTGVVIQAIMVAVGKLVPAVGQIPNFYAIVGTVLSVITGALFSRWSPGVAAGQAAIGGAAAGGSSSLIGGLLAVATGQWPGFQALQLILPALSGGVGGGIGGVLGRLLSPSKAS